MKVAIVGSGISGLTAAYALREHHQVTLFEREDQRRRPRQDRARRDAGRPDPGGHRLHRLQRADVPAVHRPARRARRRDATDRHVPGLGLPAPAASSSARAAPAASSPARPPSDPPSGGCFATCSASTATRGAILDGAGAARATLGDYLDDRGFGESFRDTSWSRSCRPSGPPRRTGSLDFPVDYLLRFLDNHGLIGVRRALRVADVARRLDGVRATGSSARCRGRRAGGRPVAGGRARRAPASTVATAAAAASTSTRWSWPPTPTTPWPARDADDRERAALGGFDYTDQPRSSSTPTSESCPADRRAGVVERRRGRLPRPAAALTMTYHMNRLQSLAGPARTSCRSTRATGSAPDRVDRRARVEPPALHVPDARRAGRPSGAAGPSADLLRGAHLGLRVPRGWLPVRLRGRGDDRRTPRGGGGMRSHLLEGTVAIGARGRRLRARARRLLPGARPRRARRGRPRAPPRQPQPARTCSPSATRDHWPPPATDLRASVLRPPARRGRGPDRLADHARHEPARPRLRLQPGQLLPLPRRGGRLRVVIVEVHNTHLERHLYTLRPRDDGRPVPAVDGEGVLRLAVHRHGRRLHGPRPDDGRTACASASTSGRTTRPLLARASSCAAAR